MNFIKGVLNDIRRKQNLDIYITIVVAIAISVLGILQVADSIVIFSATLATLALVSFSLLENRRQSESIEQTLSSIDISKYGAERFLRTDFTVFPLKERISNAQKIYFWGFNFLATVPVLMNSIEDGLVNGLEARFLLIKAHSNSEDMAVFCSRNQDKSSFSNAIFASIRNLSQLSNKAGKGSLEIRVLDCLPPYKFISIDPHLPTGVLIIQPVSFRIARNKAPFFELHNSTDNKLIAHFQNQFEIVWKEGETI